MGRGVGSSRRSAGPKISTRGGWSASATIRCGRFSRTGRPSSGASQTRKLVLSFRVSDVFSWPPVTLTRSSPPSPWSPNSSMASRADRSSLVSNVTWVPRTATMSPVEPSTTRGGSLVYGGYW